MIAQVVVDVPNSQVDRIFDYVVPPHMQVFKGSQVVVNFANRKIKGFVIGFETTSSYVGGQLKPLISVNEEMQILPELVDLCFELKNKFYLKMIDCLRLCFPTVIRENQAKQLTKNWLSLSASTELINAYISSLSARSKNKLACIIYLQQHAKAQKAFLNKTFGTLNIKGLLEDGVLFETTELISRKPLVTATSPKTQKTVVLNQMQQRAVTEILQSNEKPVLLHGVTGSGKTEVYLHVIEQMLSEGKSAIMLVPEISLTPQMVSRFTERFGNLVAVWHSGLSAGEKFDEWNRLYNCTARVVVGARSAIFSPMKNLGVIIIDEEHDNSYISDTNPRYITQDVATIRAKICGCGLVLGSATPTVDNYLLAQNGEYKLVSLPQRVNGLPLPHVEIVDMLPEFKSGNTTPFSSTLLRELENVVARGEQAMLFINRRGFASFIMCRDCGHVPNCEQCDVSLVYHRGDNLLKCHYCGKKYRTLTKCPKCMSQNLKLGGIGTERVVDDLKQLFPSVAVFRMDNDTTKNKNSHAQILSEFSKTTPAFLVGTQMIAKGHDFPQISLVGILDADLSLYFGAFRAAENTFQLITQVAGRAGRSTVAGRVVLQTYFPKHFVYKLASNHDYLRFYEKEINLREVTNFPPFSSLLRVLITSENETIAKDQTHDLFLKLKTLQQKHKHDWLFLEAMRAPVNKIKNKHRFQIVMRFLKNEDILRQIYEFCDTIKHKDITIFVEVNPQNLS